MNYSLFYQTFFKLILIGLLNLSSGILTMDFIQHTQNNNITPRLKGQETELYNQTSDDETIYQPFLNNGCLGAKKSIIFDKKNAEKIYINTNDEHSNILNLYKSRTEQSYCGKISFVKNEQQLVLLKTFINSKSVIAQFSSKTFLLRPFIKTKDCWQLSSSDDTFSFESDFNFDCNRSGYKTPDGFVDSGVFELNKLDKNIVTTLPEDTIQYSCNNLKNTSFENAYLYVKTFTDKIKLLSNDGVHSIEAPINPNLKNSTHVFINKEDLTVIDDSQDVTTKNKITVYTSNNCVDTYGVITIEKGYVDQLLNYNKSNNQHTLFIHDNETQATLKIIIVDLKADTAIHNARWTHIEKRQKEGDNTTPAKYDNVTEIKSKSKKTQSYFSTKILGGGVAIISILIAVAYKFNQLPSYFMNNINFLISLPTNFFTYR